MIVDSSTLKQGAGQPHCELSLGSRETWWLETSRATLRPVLDRPPCEGIARDDQRSESMVVCCDLPSLRARCFFYLVFLVKGITAAVVTLRA